jgi:deferrochelatase/peroxidase EfeB
VKTGTSDSVRPTRRGLARTAAGLAAAAAGLEMRGRRPALAADRPGNAPDENHGASEPFWGAHQGGILTPAQHHTYAAAFDIVTENRDEVIAIFRAWTAAAARMSRGEPVQPLQRDAATALPDSNEVVGLVPARLTLTFGFGAGLFIKDGKDRYGLADQRPDALVDLPKFEGDELEETRTGGDVSVQACAEDAAVAFNAVRQLARLAHGKVLIRWAQPGFLPATKPNQTPRNPMGFKDGIVNPSIGDPAVMEQVVWVGADGPAWMRDGTYVVMRRIRIALEHWDRMPLDFQEQAVGRHKFSGAPLGGESEFDPADLTAKNRDGDLVIPASAHIRLAAAGSNDGAQILRRPYAYNDGVGFVAERWPPWRRGMEYDAGLFFVCYQRDPRAGFIKIFDKLAKFDMMSQFVTHTGGGLFACPGGIADGEFVGQRLFEPSHADFPRAVAPALKAS